MGASMKLLVKYFKETDVLDLWNGRAANNGEDIANNLIADFNDDDEVVGLTLFHAKELLGPALELPAPESVERKNPSGRKTVGVVELLIDYDNGKDTLCLRNGQPGKKATSVADNLIVNSDDDDVIVGFTIDHAKELLSPLFGFRSD